MWARYKTFDTIDIFWLLFAAVVVVCSSWVEKIVLSSALLAQYLLWWRHLLPVIEVCVKTKQINISPLSKEFYKIFDGFSADDDDLLRAI